MKGIVHAIIFSSNFRNARSSIRAVLRRIIPTIPLRSQQLLAELGFPHYCAKNIKYIGKCYRSKFKIFADTSYQIEINATQRSIPKHEAISGIMKLIKSGDVIIDVGANVGTYSIKMAEAGPNKILSIEPGPFFKKLVSNIELNDLGTIIVPLNIGITDSIQEYFWHEDLNNPGNAHVLQAGQELDLSKVATNLSREPIEIKCVRLDELVSDLGINKVSLIKIDVELMEWEVICSASKVIETQLPVLVIETSHDSIDILGIDRNEMIFNYLYGLGYKSYIFQDGLFSKITLIDYGKDTFFSQFSLELL